MRLSLQDSDGEGISTPCTVSRKRAHWHRKHWNNDQVSYCRDNCSAQVFPIAVTVLPLLQFNKFKRKKSFLNRKGKKRTHSTKPPHLETQGRPPRKNKQLISFVQKGIKNNISFTGKTGGRYLWEDESSQRKPQLMKLTVYTIDVVLKSLPAPETKIKKKKKKKKTHTSN